ncbi:hypothetical protein D3C86_1388330 [compost metagenome]
MLILSKLKNKKILFLNQPPRVDVFEDKNSAQYFSFLGFKPILNQIQFLKVKDNERIIAKNNYLKNYEKKNIDISIFDIYQGFSKNNWVKIVSYKNILYYDDDHLSYQGTQIMKKALGQKIKAILSN